MTSSGGRSDDGKGYRPIHLLFYLFTGCDVAVALASYVFFACFGFESGCILEAFIERFLVGVELNSGGGCPW